MRTLRLLTLLLVAVIATYSGDFQSGSNTCPSSGNKQVSLTQYNLYQLTVIASASNTGVIFLGGSSVNTTTGIYITPGGSYNVSRPNAGISPTTLFFACTVNTDALTWTGNR